MIAFGASPDGGRRPRSPHPLDALGAARPARRADRAARRVCLPGLLRARPRERVGGRSRCSAEPKTNGPSDDHPDVPALDAGTDAALRPRREPPRRLRPIRGSMGSSACTRPARSSSSRARSRPTTRWRATRPRPSTRCCASCSPRRADHHVRAVLAGSGRRHEAPRDRGDLPRRLGHLGQGIGARGSGPGPRQLPAEARSPTRRPGSCAPCSPPIATRTSRAAA